MKIVKSRLFSGGRVGQETDEQRREKAYEYLEKLKEEGEKVIETYEEKGYLVIKIEE